MCEQTEINYLDGDVVWVKLGACWWPGQVTSFHNLPEDIQIEFQKKPLIAAVKFFQEDTYEFVKNLHQIYKYNCTQKDDFIKKGLDKYRAKSKDGSSYMDKFPGDIEMAEKLTGGDPDILTSEKFTREEKPDISALFGEKKVPKKKRDREEGNRRSDGNAMMRKITHPRFLRESDHEIRIRQQPSSLPSTPRTPSTDSPQYSCNLCNFTSTRVNVIICHRKSHCSGGGYESPLARPRITSYSQSKSSGRSSLPGETQKRKYVRKSKSLSGKSKSEHTSEPVKRKLNKQSEKTVSKKKKTDPELREKLLADWDDETDEEMDIDLNKSTDTVSSRSPSVSNNNPLPRTNSSDDVEEKDDDGADLITASEKLLRETEKFASFHGDDSSSRTSRQSNNKNHDDLDAETGTIAKEEKTPAYKNPKKLIASSVDERKSTGSEKDDKQSRFSCFDFDEEDVPEPTITPVRKIPRIFGEKNTSVKKGMLKKFKEEQEESEEKAANAQDFFEKKEPTAKEKKQPDLHFEKEKTNLSAKEEVYEKTKVETLSKNEESKNLSKALTVTELEIVEIFEVEGEKDEREDGDEITKKSVNYEIETFSIGGSMDNKMTEEKSEGGQDCKDSGNEAKEDSQRRKNCQGEKEETMSEQAMTETEDETISEIADSLRGNSENSDTDGNLNQTTWGAPLNALLGSEGTPEKAAPRRRGRPRKSLPAVDSSGNGSDSPKHEIIRKNIANLASRDSERKTSESDSERSYSGRRRKPNKKYLHSDLYTSSPDNRASKTDESQSESEEKSQKEQKITRPRRGKKKFSSILAESGIESSDKTKDQEFEFSNRTIDSTNMTKINEQMSRVNETKTDMEIEGESSASGVADFGKKLDSGIGSPVNITKFLSSSDIETSKHVQDQEEKSDRFQMRDRFEPVIETVTMTPEDMEMCMDEAKNNSKFDSLKSNVDKLPPKKSQIKKFELSQIDLLDACAEQVAAEQAAAEKLMAEKYAAEKLAAEKLAAEKLAAERLAAEKLAAEKLAAEKLAAEKLAAEKEAAEKLAAEKAEAERLVAEKEAAEKLIAEKLAAEKLAAEKAAAELLAAEQLATEKLLSEKAALEKLSVEQILAEDGEKLEEKKLITEEIKISEEKKSENEQMETEPSNSEAKFVDNDFTPDHISKQVEKLVDTAPMKTEKEDTISSNAEEAKVQEPVTSDSTMETIEAVLARITNEEVINESTTSVKRPTEIKSSDISKVEKSPAKQATQSPAEALQTSVQSRSKGKSAPEVSPKVKTPVTDEEIPINSFQEAFVKTLHIDNKDEKEGQKDNEKSDVSIQKAKPQSASDKNSESQPTVVIAIASSDETVGTPTSVSDTQNVQPLNAMTEFEGVEILVQDSVVEVETKMEESGSQMDLAAALVGSDLKPDAATTLSLDLQKIQDTLSDNVSTPSPTSEVSVPVKKREKPRIIENVTLKEPMQILKNKLLEKLPSKSTKHKLESDGQRKNEAKGSPRAKVMKLETSGNVKARASPKTGSQMTITRKLQVLKAEEAATAAAIEKEKAAQTQISQTISLPTGEKFIQQSSQSLADMELDINSMPFVLSEDVLTPESIEQMPVVISSIIPSSSTTVPTTLALTPSTQPASNSEIQLKGAISETVTTEHTGTPKKKSGTPAILKAKGKAKPTITSIKTLVPPFAGGVKGLKFQSQQTVAGKAIPLDSQKNTPPGKYVIVQTAGGQQVRYSVQGRPGSQQKIAIPAGNATGSAQIVQQGGKVVILTSAQSGQTKMLPLNISKTMSGKVQKISNNKGQLYTPMSPQGLINQKTIIAPKTDTSSPTTSKLPQGQKIINPQGIITSKRVLTPISSAKPSLLSPLSQGIITSGGIYTPISSAQLGRKTIIGKTLVSKAGTTILSPLGAQTISTSKGTILPMSHAIGRKTIINAQGIVPTKATVLTPITGQQVKAIAAKSPVKGAKVQYQTMQTTTQKLHLPLLQKGPKVPVSTSTQVRPGASVKSPGGTILFQNTVANAQKTVSPTGKKIIRQINQQQVRSPQTPHASPQQVLQRAKTSATATSVQRVVTPRGTGRQTKQKILVQKMETSIDGGASSSPTVNTQVKPIMSSSIVGTVAKSPNTMTSKQTPRSAKTRVVQKNLLNVAGSSALSTSTAGNETLSTVSVSPAQPLHNLPMPSLVIPGTELPISEAELSGKTEMTVETVKDTFKQDVTKTEPAIETPKLEASKVTSAQPQIMALPTESSDGTQTYVLVTIDEQGQIQPLDNNTLMSLEGTTQNADGTRTLYIDPSSLGEAGTLDNIVLQFDNGALPNLQTSACETSQTIATTDNFPSTEIIQTSNQDILAEALANTDFQQEIGLPESATSSVMTTGMTQTSLINQTILQSTIIPPTEPISSPSVLETSLTLNQPIMTPLEVPSSLPIQVNPNPPTVVSTIPTSLELPITITDPTISYISTAAATSETHIRIPGNSMPDIGEIMDSSASADVGGVDIPTSTRYLVLPVLDDNMPIQSRENETTETVPVSYSVSIPENIVIDNSQAQTTPSMPIIDDSFVETPEQKFSEEGNTEVIPPKASDSGVTTSEKMELIANQENIETESQTERAKGSTSLDSRDVIETEKMIIEEESTPDAPKKEVTEKEQEPVIEMQIDEQSAEVITTCTSAIEESTSSDMHIDTELSKTITIESTNDSQVAESVSEEVGLNSLAKEETVDKAEPSLVQQQEQINTSGLDSPSPNVSQVASANMEVERDSMVVEEAVEMEILPSQNPETPDGSQAVEGSSSQPVPAAANDNVEIRLDEITEASPEEEAPSQSYEQFSTSGVTSDSAEIPTQSATKSENSREPTQSVAYEAMEIDESPGSGEPPTQSFEDTKRNEASQSYETANELNTNAPTQSFNEIMQGQPEAEEPTTGTESIDDQSFPTQSYEVGKIDNLSENLESDASAIGQEGNIPSQSNDVGNDGIGTSSVSINNSGLNEDETASSSYVPETPENQERDQDQESAISTSSYEILPCEELNIASSSVIPDTSVRGEHMSIHDNGVPEIPTSSYSLNPDSSSTSHVDALPTSSYEEDQVIVEQNVSTSYEVPISMPGIEEQSSQNFVTESTDHRNEPTSYYARHQEVTASYYEPANQDSNSRLESEAQEEVTPSYYEQPQDITSEASQSYFRSTPRYSSQNVSPGYYDPTPETEASQSSYYSHELEGTEQSSRNVEASQSFYQETTTTSDEQRLRQQGEATPTYTERYPVDYALENSPIERHDLVESSVPATRPTER